MSRAINWVRSFVMTTVHGYLTTRMANVKIVKNLSLVVLDCTFTMYSARVYSISQW